MSSFARMVWIARIRRASTSRIGLRSGCTHVWVVVHSQLSPAHPHVGDIWPKRPKSRGCRPLWGPGVDPNLRLSPKGPRKPTRRTGGLLPDRRDGGRKGGSGTRSRISREARPPAAAPSNTEVPSGLLVPAAPCAGPARRRRPSPRPSFAKASAQARPPPVTRAARCSLVGLARRATRGPP